MEYFITHLPSERTQEFSTQTLLRNCSFNQENSVQTLLSTKPLCRWAILQRAADDTPTPVPFLLGFGGLLKITPCGKSILLLTAKKVKLNGEKKRCVCLARWSWGGLTERHQWKCITPRKRCGWRTLAVKEDGLCEADCWLITVHVERMPEWTPQF